MSHLNKNQIKATNQTSIVSYEDDDCEDIALNQRHSMSSGKRRSEQHAPRPEYSSHIERDDHSHNDDGYKKNYSHHGSSHHYNNDHRSHDRSSSSSRNHHRSSRTNRDNSINKLRERSESPDTSHHHHRNKRELESRHKHGGNCRKSKRDRSPHHHHQHTRTRRLNSHRSNRSHDADRRKEQFSKPKESKLDTSTSSSKHSIVECNKSDIKKSVDSSEVISNQVPATTNTKPKGPPAAVLASVAAVMASIKAQQPSESVLNRISIQQPNSLQPTDIPKYYNAKMVNAAKLAQQAEKRKLLWGDNKSSANEKVKPSSTTSANVWTNLKFQGEHGMAMTEKFRKLMGIKTADTSNQQQLLSSIQDDVKDSNHHNEDIVVANQEKLFENLDQQYSIARRSTHLARGVGLGFTAAGMSTSFQRNYDENDK
ncbi:Small acidic protein [Dermatophagoides pteronyssinus]|uniref:Small acidic protein n=1 Tax=Dermatophagoides pteronyssinus TaxID=6956 RepID=A0ABQ8JHW0_DERPT|nr:Small acidic protein [Dermatophagoides pteronyssinus]